jgi:hypothetical protein
MSLAIDVYFLPWTFYSTAICNSEKRADFATLNLYLKELLWSEYNDLWICKKTV